MKIDWRGHCRSAGLILAAGAMLAGCSRMPFGGELARNAALPSTAAPMPIEATYQTETEVTKPVAGAPPPATDPATTASIARPAESPAADQPPAGTSSALLSPEEKARVIAELEAMAKKQGAELTAERAKADAACDNLGADALRKKMLEGAC